MDNLPRFLEISDILVAEIRAGLYPPGARFPSESDLAHRFDVSRYGIRQALDRLVQAGLLRPLQGVGYLVRRVPLTIQYTIASASHYSREIQALGYVPGLELACSSEEAAPGDVAAELDLTAGDPVYRLEIIRKADGVAVSWCVTWLPVSLFPDLSARLNQMHSLYDLLRESYDVDPRRDRTTFRAAHFTAKDAVCLGIDHPVPILSGTNVARDQHGRVVEFTQMRSRGDLCCVTIPFGPAQYQRQDQTQDQALDEEANEDVQA